MTYQKICVFLFICLFATCAQATHWTIKSVSRIVDNQTMRPQSHDFFTHFDPPYLHDGKIVFRGFNGKKNAGVYTNIKGTLQVIAHNKMRPFNSRRFYAFGHNNLPSTDNLPIIFKKKIVFFGNGDGNILTGVYYFDDNKIFPIATRRTVIPNGAKGLFTYFLDPGFLDKKQVAFIGLGEKGVTGIYTADTKQKVQTLLDYKTKMPNIDANFQEFSQLALPQNGQSEDFVLMGSDGHEHFGVYLYHNGKLSLITAHDTEIPEGTGYFKNIKNIAFDDKTDQVIFIGEGILGQSGLYLYKKNKLIKAIDQQNTIPEEDDQFSKIEAASIYDGKIAFQATGHKEQKGIYLYTPKGLFHIVDTHDKIDKKEIKTIGLSKGSFNDDQLALTIEFVNGENAIYILTLEGS
jgi:hypothetical protein